MLPTRFVRTLGNGSVVSQNMEPFFSTLNISRHTYCSGYDEHACDTIFFLMLETKESISEIDNHHILQEASEL